MNEGHDSLLTRGAELIVRYGLVVVILCLPLEFTSALLGLQISRAVLLIVAAAFVYLLVVRRRSLVLPRYPSVYLLLLYVVASLASWLFTRPPGSYNAVLDLTLYPVVALLVTNLVLSEQDHRRAWIALAVSSLGVALVGAFLYLTHLQIWTPNPAVASRLNITFGDPNITARFLTLGACAAVVMFASRQGPPWVAVSAAIACAVLTPLTFSRSGLALFVVSVAIAVAFAFDRRRAAALGATALVVFAVWTGVNPDTRQRAQDAAYTAVSLVSGASLHHNGAAGGHQPAVASDDNRRYLIAAGLKMAIDHPILGVGFGGYQQALVTTYNRFLPAAYTDSVSHTAFVTVAAEQGSIGLLLILAFLIQLARETLSGMIRRDEMSLWVALPAAIIVPIVLYSQFEGRFLQEPYLWLALGLLYSAQMRAHRGEVVNGDVRPRAAAAA